MISSLDSLTRALFDGRVELTPDLPDFGGGAPADTSEVWSWDSTRLLVGTSIDDLTLYRRGAFRGPDDFPPTAFEPTNDDYCSHMADFSDADFLRVALYCLDQAGSFFDGSWNESRRSGSGLKGRFYRLYHEIEDLIKEQMEVE